ncbi:OmpP1/FadL family transporter [Oceanicaulis alexandrii]|uniref:OmpP1/FadL family transporter n=1 Tax=Oceanicaulis alexandrii TaxID=153233 RepID=UPI0003B3935A|nr:porin [Oceanicaulis alexandrii]
MLRTPPLLAHLGLAAGLALTTATPALAGGFKLSEYSVRDLGMADAGYAALADDPSTIWSNPAGLARLDGLQVQVGAHAIIGQGDFTNAGSVDVLGRPLGGTEENDLFNDAVIPNFYLSRRLNDRVVLGLGVTAPFGLATEYNQDSVTRFQSVKSALKVAEINPSLGVQVTDRLSLGFGVSAQYSEATLASHIDFSAVCLGQLSAAQCTATGFLPGRPEGYLRVTGDDWAFGWNVGALYDLTETTRIGVSYRSKVDHTLEGEADFGAPANAALFQPAFTDTPGSAELNLPAELAVSVAHQVNDQLSLNASVAYTFWDFERLVVEFDNPAQPAAGETLGYDGVARYAIGGEYRYNTRLTLRAGLAYDESPTEDEHRTTRVPDSDRTIVALGASYQLTEALQLDAGYQHLMFDDAPINHVGSTGDRVIGEYDNVADIVGLSLTWRR